MLILGVFTFFFFQIVHGIPQNLYVNVEPVEHAHAEGVLGAIEKSMASVDPGWNWKEKLVATGSDGASVNLGKHKSVTALLKKEVPHLIAMHCVSHRLELGALDAMKQRDAQIFSDLKSVLMMIHKHYHYSAKALRELQMVAEAMEIKLIRPTNLEGTRWMPHLSKSLENLLKSYVVIVNHFEDTIQGKKGTADVQGRAKNILKHLKSHKLLHYIHFICDVLAILAELSLQFQRDSCTLPDALSALETACLCLVALKQRPGENLQKFNDGLDNNTFHGVVLSAPELSNQQLKDKEDKLVDTVLEHLTKRLGDIDSSELLKAMQIFYPVNFPLNEADIATYGEEELKRLCEYYHELILARFNCDIQHLQQVEWPAMKVYMKKQPRSVDLESYFKTLFTTPCLVERFSNILVLIEIILCIPVSSAVCERGFSAMARIKSDWRASLTHEMLNYLMAISIHGPAVEQYNCEHALELWFRGGDRARRPVFTNQE